MSLQLRLTALGNSRSPLIIKKTLKLSDLRIKNGRARIDVVANRLLSLAIQKLATLRIAHGSPSTHRISTHRNPNSPNLNILTFLTWVYLPHQLQHGYTSKVTSLQVLLRKTFRSPGVLVLGDFGFSAYFYRSRSDR